MIPHAPAWKRYWKAIAGALATGLGAFATAAADNEITTSEWALIGVAILGGAGIVAGAPANEPK